MPTINTTGLVGYRLSPISLSGTLSGTSSFAPYFTSTAYASDLLPTPLTEEGVYSFEIVRDSRWNNDGSYLTALGTVTHPDGSTRPLVGRLNTFMGGIIFSDSAFDFGADDRISTSFDSYLNVGNFAPDNSADIGKKFSFSVTAVTVPFSLIPSASSIAEGASVVFKVTALASISPGTLVNYSILGISASDTSASLTGSTRINTEGVATITVPLLEDEINEGNETLTFTVGGIDSRVTVLDTSKAPASYTLVPNKAQFSEGENAVFTLTVTNVLQGTKLPYTITGVSAEDVVGGLSGTTTVGPYGSALITVPLVADYFTEGSETITVTVKNTSASATVLDTSKTQILTSPVQFTANNHYYALLKGHSSWLSALNAAASESYRGLGGYLATVTSAAEDTFIYNSVITPLSLPITDGYSIGLGATDAAVEGAWRWATGPEAGQVLVYQHWLSGQPDSGTRQNYLSYALGSSFWEDMYPDASVDPQGYAGFVVEFGGLPASYVITPSASAIEEGQSITFTIDTKNVEWGQSISYSLSNNGVSVQDLSAGSMSGSVQVLQKGLDGTASVSFTLAKDLLTEGSETLTFNVGGVSSQVIVKDASLSTAASLAVGTLGKDSFNWSAASSFKSFSGDLGLDTLSVAGNKKSFTFTSSSITDRSTSNKASLDSIERLKFTDGHVALDTSSDGNAGKALLMLGAVLGKESVKTPALVGLAIGLYDLGTLPSSSIASTALAAVLGENPTDTSVVNLLYKNLTGVTPDPVSLSLYTSLIKAGVLTQSSLAQMAADNDLNKANINLVGLMQDGVDFIPSLI